MTRQRTIHSQLFRFNFISCKRISFILFFIAFSDSLFSQDGEEGDFKCETVSGKKRCTAHVYGQRTTTTILYYYNKKDQLIKRTELEGQNEEETFSFEEEYTYDENGLLIRRGNNFYEYYPNGLLKSVTYKSTSGKAVNSFSYNKEDNLVEGKFVTVKGDYEIHYYNPDVPQKPILVFDTLSRDVHELYFQNRIDSALGYNKKHKLVSTTYNRYNKSGKLVSWVKWGTALSNKGPDKEILYENEYDDDGDLRIHTVITRYRRDKKPVEVIRFDGRGNKIKQVKYE